MKKRKSKPDSAGACRRRAETRLRRQKTEKVTPASGQDTARLLHELQVHQVELEMQNEELIRARAEVEAGLERYTDLYDFAPAGYFTLDPDGKIRQANITGASLLGLERARLVRFGLGRFVAPDDSNQWGQYLRSIEQSDTKQTCELRFTRADGSTFWAQLEGIRLARPGRQADDETAPAIRVAISDVTERRQIRDAQSFLLQLRLHPA